MSAGGPQDLIRDLVSGLNESVVYEWRTKKGEYNGTTKKSFTEIINEIKMIKKKDKFNELRYNDRSVELLVQAGRLAPVSEYYPHPEIEALFEHKKEMEVTSDCVAAWAGGSAFGIRTKDRKIRKGIIIGIYGGKITKERGIYVLDATVSGDDVKWIDGNPDLRDIAMFGRINGGHKCGDRRLWHSIHHRGDWRKNGSVNDIWGVLQLEPCDRGWTESAKEGP